MSRKFQKFWFSCIVLAKHALRKIHHNTFQSIVQWVHHWLVSSAHQTTISQTSLSSFSECRLYLLITPFICIVQQRRQSGLKSGGVVDPGKKNYFLGKFRKNFDFFRQLDKQKIDLSGQISEKFRFFTGTFNFSRQILEEFRFFRQFHIDISIF